MIPHNAGQPTRHVVRYDAERQCIWLEPDCPEIEAELSLRTIAGADDADHGYRLDRRMESLLSCSRSTANAGLAHVAAYRLMQLGHDVVINEPPVRRLAAPVASNNPHVADLVHARSHGLVRHSLGFPELTALCADLACAFPDARITYIAARKHDARQLHAVLAGQFGPVALAFPDRCLHARARLTAATPYGLGHPDVIADPIDVLICLDAADAVSEAGAMAIAASGLARTKLFGFVRDERKLPPRIRDLVMSAFGPWEVSVPRLGSQSCPIEIAWMRVVGGPHVTSASPAVLYRRGVVHHPVRNRRIASLGGALVTGDRIAIQQICPDVFEKKMLAPFKTTIVVSGVDHAIELARRLPDWGVVVSDAANLDGLSRSQRATATDRYRPYGPGWIVTVAALPDFPLLACGAVLWAAGGVGLPPVPNSWLICSAGQDRELLWIDFQDAHHRDLLRASRSRRKAYSAAGWFPSGTRGTIARIRQFLAERSGGDA